MRSALALVVALLLLAGIAGPAGATILEANDVTSYSMAADPGYVIYQVIIGDVPIGTNQSHVLNYNGAVFLLNVETWTDYGIWRNARISLTLPNGTVQYADTSVTTIVSQYKTTIQPVFAQAQSGTVTFLTVDLMIGVNPAGAQFSTQPLGWNPEAAIPFSSVSGEIGTETDVYVHESTLDDYKKNILNYNPVYGLKNLGSDVFQWTWAATLGFVAMIPIIGPYFVTLLDIVGTIAGELLFWTIWIMENLPAIILSAETVIIMAAIVNSGKKTNLSKAGKNFVNYHIMLITGFFGLIGYLRMLIYDTISLVTTIVNALKPV